MTRLKITVDGKPYEVEVEFLDEASAVAEQPATERKAPMPPSSPSEGSPSDGEVASPLAGTVVSIDVQQGQTVRAGEKLITLEAMKMNTVVAAPSDGKVSLIRIKPGDAVEEGTPLINLS